MSFLRKIDIKSGNIVRPHLAPPAIGEMNDGLVDIRFNGFLQPAQNFMVNDVPPAVKGKTNARSLPKIFGLPSLPAYGQQRIVIPAESNFRTLMPQPESQAS
ncbi:MAG: hypothetical protein BWX99_02540 [Deltaproteobacteria bacterium ADurb.Bin151]|nr:MAG: hypothetical protein BWX99_02540 [Deltaproteobacteria bacterium ADurb.Bin151]